MLTKYYIEIDGIRHEVPSRCIKNWDEVRCIYKRPDYSGVTRSFTSQFEFVHEAYEMLMSLYLRDGFNAVAILYLYTITDRWEWEERFAAPIDFTSITWDSHILKVNCIDNSLAARIKTNKSVKYEFAVGTDIVRDSVLNFDRVPMIENVTYGFTKGDSYNDSGDILVQQTLGTRMWLGNIGSEICIKNAIQWNDDQEDTDNGYLLQALRDVEVLIDYEYSYRSDHGNGAGLRLQFGIIRNGVAIPANSDWYLGSIYKASILTGNYSSPEDLPDAGSQFDQTYAIIDGSVWLCTYCGFTMPNGNSYEWRNLNKTPEEVFLNTQRGQFSVQLQQGDKIIIDAQASGSSYQGATFRCVSSRFVFSWLSRGDNVNIDVFRPKNIVNSILKRIGGDKINISATISDYDSRLENTFLMAAESARGIPTAKFYSSFDEFCNWMSTVFGYTYYLGDRISKKYRKIAPVGNSFQTPWHHDNSAWYGAVSETNITFVAGYGKFFYIPQGENKLYTQWEGSTDYRDENGYPLTDVLYRIDGKLYYFEEYNAAPPRPIPYEFDNENLDIPFQQIHFVHRSELFDSSNLIKKFANAREVSFSIDSQNIYSSIVIGYDKKEYDRLNGRDEFNFSNTYSTGQTVIEKTLSLISKYRADCYGIEFAVQKRGQDTTDSTSDKDVFFILANEDNGSIVPDRSISIQNTISNLVFNGAFSPMACVRANAGYIGMQAKRLYLEFASSAGNSNIVIGGQPMSGNIELDTPLMTCGRVSFVTDEVDEPAAVDQPIEIESEGILYRGFLEEATFKYAKNEAVKYKLIVKDIEL